MISPNWTFGRANGRPIGIDSGNGARAHYRPCRLLLLNRKHIGLSDVNAVDTLAATSVTRRRTPRNTGADPRSATSATTAIAAAATTASLPAPPANPAPATTSRDAVTLPSDLLLSDIRVVLVAPKHEANIGAVARACANFECLNLVLVAPRCSADGSEARKVACGDTVLDRLTVVGSLAEALADTAGSVGFTRRAGATRLTHASLGHLLAEFPWAVPMQPPAQAASAVSSPTEERGTGATGVLGEAADGGGGATALRAAEPGRNSPEEARVAAGRGQQKGLGGDMQAEAPGEEAEAAGLTERGASGPFVTALVFGREESGLTEAELRLCSHACAIPTGRVQPSMNLSHAVAVVLAEVFSRRCGLLDVDSPDAVDEATAAMGPGDRAQLLRLPPGVPQPRAVRHTEPGAADADSSGSAASADGNASSADGDVAGPLGTSDRIAAPVVPLVSGPGSTGSSAATGSTMVVQGPAGRGSVDAGLLPARAQEVDLLVRKVAAVAEAVGMRGEEAAGGGNKGNHGRRRLPVGHLRQVLSRARVSQAESRSLHGLASAVLQRLDPDHPLEARKRQRKQQQQQQDVPAARDEESEPRT